MRVAREVWILAMLGIADLITTVVFIQHHGAQEANPLFRSLWERGLPAFICVKLLFLIGPLSFLEWARRHHRPRFVTWALRSGILGYLLVYGVGYYQNNGPTAQQYEVLHAREMYQQEMAWATRNAWRRTAERETLFPSEPTPLPLLSASTRPSKP